MKNIGRIGRNSYNMSLTVQQSCQILGEQICGITLWMLDIRGNQDLHFTQYTIEVSCD